MSVSVTIIGPCSCSTTPSVLIQTDRHRYLINAGDGLQRCCNEYKVRLSKLDRLLFTGLTAETLGGLCGLLLTVGDAVSTRDPKIHIYGPKMMSNFIISLRHFFRRPNMALIINEIEEPSRSLSEDDSSLDIVPLIVYYDPELPLEVHRSAKRPRVEANSDPMVYPVDVQNLPKKFAQITINSTQKQDQEPLSDCKQLKRYTCSYLIRAKACRGKFLPKKAIELGVTPGPDFGKLTRGIPVTNNKGVQVHPFQCMEMADTSQIVLVLDCPSIVCIEKLAQELDTKLLSQRDPERGTIRCVVHLSPIDVIESPLYEEKIILALDEDSAKESVIIDHIIATSGACTDKPVFISSQRIQNTLNQVCPEMFRNCSKESFGIETISRLRRTRESRLKSQAISKPSSRIHCAEALMSYVVFPKQSRGVKRDTRIHATDECPLPLDGLENDIDEFKSFIKQQVNTEANTPIEFTFLGTGAALPSKYRNVSSTLVRICDDLKHDKNKSILFDCGEGTYFQLCRRFGIKTALQIVKQELELIWISHMHADHHLGLLKVLVTRKLSEAGKVCIVAPKAMLLFLQEYEAIDPRIRNTYDFAPCMKDSSSSTSGCLTQPPKVFDVGVIGNHAYNEVIKVVKRKTGLRLLSSIPVQHCFDAYGLVLELNSGFKIVYSGDTEPCDTLVKAGMNADVLIHEATLDDEKVTEAREKKHSTVSEAVKVGRDMFARTIILSHFSQRYPKIPIINKLPIPESPHSDFVANKNVDNVIVAFDLMSLKLNQIKWCPRLLPILQRIFNECK